MTRSPSSALLPFLFLGEGSPTKIDYRKKSGALILTSPLKTQLRKAAAEGFAAGPGCGQRRLALRLLLRPRRRPAALPGTGAGARRCESARRGALSWRQLARSWRWVAPSHPLSLLSF